MLVAAGFADYSLIAYRLHASLGIGGSLLPIFYSVAMAASGSGALLFGKLFDRFGIAALVPLTIVGALFAPLVFLGNFTLAIAGVAVWGIGMGVQESIIPAAAASMVPAQRRQLLASGYCGRRAGTRSLAGRDRSMARALASLERRTLPPRHPACRCFAQPAYRPR